MSVPELLAIAVAALGGSERSGQQQMAAAVAQAFETGEHLVVQAGTGTGKSLAYLVPAIVRAVNDDAPGRGVDGDHRACSANSSIAICPGWPIRSPTRCPAARIRVAQRASKLPVPEQDSRWRGRAMRED